jgi:HK97 family phage major capsid protein
VLPSLYSMVGPKSDGTSMIYTSGDQYPTAAGAPFGTILGRPVIPCEQCATLGTEGDVFFADLGWYATATKGGVNQAMSIHLRFDYGEVAFRYDFRVDGQPWLNSTITPANGTATQSPFITFAVRA